jgi:hypothetical protein
MKQLSQEASTSKRGVLGALTNKRASDSRARALVSTLRKLRAAAFVSRQALADELIEGEYRLPVAVYDRTPQW